MGRVWAIAINTFREAVRDRVLYGVLGFATALLLFTLALAELSLDQQARVVRDLGLASISLFSVVVAIFLGSSLLYKEIERKTLYVILPKPIRRHEFLIGKYAGIALTAIVFVAIMGALQLWLAAIQAGASATLLVIEPVVLGVALGLALWKAKDRTSVLVPFSLVALAASAGVAQSAGVAVGPTLAALTLDVGEVLVVAAVALFFSSFSTPFLTGVLTVGVWLVGRSADEMATMRSNVLPDSVRDLLHGLAWVVPNLNLFVPPHRALTEHVEGSGGPVEYVASAMGYGALYAGILIVMACVVFRRRDFL
ncbi:ABC transporter permease [Sandaracinus amylolyticus]|uniref:ABC transporter permease n=1 Tax=Sandaracinus amylolyticus TaxID=927083 RepID=UPI001EFFCE62|nr:ABC transporter permease [Sandaracinus amylolyticus]UJR81814.1 ABC transporter permease [Sandaracinus amylolyticus]